MSDAAAHLVDDVFPEVPTRQWVCSLPWASPPDRALDGLDPGEKQAELERTGHVPQDARPMRRLERVLRHLAPDDTLIAPRLLNARLALRIVAHA